MFVMLYTSRVVLQALGAEDLGIYNVVGGIVALLSFFQSTLSKATSRFITYELGCNSSQDKLQRVFSMSMTIHIIISLIAVALAETIGLVILKFWTSIPLERQIAAFCVYQCSIFIFCIHIIRIPYDAVIIAHENMSVYAYMSVLEALLQLGMAFGLLYFSGDKLVLYGVLMLSIAVILYLAYFSYVKSKLSFYSFSFLWEKDYSKKLLSFSGWSLLGTSANVATQQGVSLLFNNFIGLLANTALGFANQVNGAVGRFVGNFTTAFNPQIIKLCAKKDYPNLYLLMNRASKFSFIMMWIMALPLIANMDFVMHLWLGDVPQYTVEFCQLILICSIIDATTGVYFTAITATGHIKLYQICISISFLLDLCCAYVLLMMNMTPSLVFGSRIVTRGFINMFIGWYFVNKQLNFDVRKHLFKVFLPIILTIILTTPCMAYICSVYEKWTCFFFSSLFSVILSGFCTLLFILTKDERKSLKHILIRSKR